MGKSFTSVGPRPPHPRQPEPPAAHGAAPALSAPQPRARDAPAAWPLPRGPLLGRPGYAGTRRHCGARGCGSGAGSGQFSAPRRRALICVARERRPLYRSRWPRTRPGTARRGEVEDGGRSGGGPAQSRLRARAFAWAASRWPGARSARPPGHLLPSCTPGAPAAHLCPGNLAALRPSNPPRLRPLRSMGHLDVMGALATAAALLPQRLRVRSSHGELVAGRLACAAP